MYKKQYSLYRWQLVQKKMEQLNSDNSATLNAELENQIFDAQIQSSIFNIINAAVIVTLLWATNNHILLSVWVISIFIVNIARFTCATLHKRNFLIHFISNKYRIYLGTLFSAVIWGSLSFLFFDVNAEQEAMLITLVLAGMAAGSVNTLSPMPKLAITYILIVIGPLFLVLISQDSAFYRSVSIMVALFIVVNITSIKRSSNKLIDNIKLRKRSEQNTRKINQQKYLLNQTGEIGLIGGWAYDIRSDSISWTQQTYQILSISSYDKPSIDTMLSRFYPKHKKLFLQQLQNCIETGESFSFEIKLATKISTKWIRILGQVKKEDGLITDIHGTAQDITESKNNEEEIDRHKKRLQDTLKSANYGTFKYSLECGCFELDSLATEMHRLNKKEKYSFKELSNSIHSDDIMPLKINFTEKLNNYIDNVINFKYRIVCSSGKTRYLEAHAFIEDDPLNNNKFVHGLIADITSFVEAENILQTANEKITAAAKEKSQFLANMSHEIRTPMNGIIGSLHLLQKTTLTDEQRAHIDTVSYSSDSLVHIINDIFELSKLESDKLKASPSPFNLRADIDQLMHILKTECSNKDLSFNVHYDSDVSLLINSDKYKISQVISNLIGNSIKYTKEGGVTVNIAITNKSLEPKLRFEITDTGIGINEENFANLFSEVSQPDNSKTHKLASSGLSLSICKKLIELMDGTIGAQSTVSTGACFWFEIPYNPVTTSNELESNSLNNLSPQFQGRILLVENSESNQFTYTEILRDKGLFVDVVESGKVAYEILQHKHYDLIFMNCQMPIMDGYETTRKIRQFETRHGKQRSIIIALTTNTLPDDKHKCNGAGMDDYLSKTSTDEALTETLNKWLNGNSPAQELKQVDSK